MKKAIAVIIAGALAFSAARRLRDVRENRSTWEASTDRVD